MTLFVSGSRSIKVLPQKAEGELNQAIAVRELILVGDCYGVDTLVQQHCKDQGYTHVRVYHIGLKPRNNLGFNTVAARGSHYYDKDILMARDADRGLVVWDGQSKGSQANIARLHAANKSMIIIAPECCSECGGSGYVPDGQGGGEFCGCGGAKGPWSRQEVSAAEVHEGGVEW